MGNKLLGRAAKEKPMTKQERLSLKLKKNTVSIPQPVPVEVIRSFSETRLDSETILRKKATGNGHGEIILLKTCERALDVFGAVSIGILQGRTFEFGIAIPAEAMNFL